MSQSSDFLASFTDTSTQAATYEGFLSDTRIDVAALLYNQGNVISYDLSFSDDPLSLFALAMPSDSQLGGSIQPPANQMPSFASASYPSLNTIAHPMRGLGDLDHHLPVISTVYSAHLNDLAVSVPGHFLAESAKGKAPLTSDETPKRKRHVSILDTAIDWTDTHTGPLSMKKAPDASGRVAETDAPSTARRISCAM
jgi:hypothetical protein